MIISLVSGCSRTNIFELSLQANAELFSVDCKEQVVGAVHAEHPIQPPLQSAMVVLQRQIEDGALWTG